MNWATLAQMFGGQAGQSNQGAGLLGQIFGGQGGQAQGILGQEIAAQPAGLQGFMAQADLHPQVGAEQQGLPWGSAEDIAKGLGQANAIQGLLNSREGQGAPAPLPSLPQGRGGMASTPQMTPSNLHEQWLASRRLPQIGILGGASHGIR